MLRKKSTELLVYEHLAKRKSLSEAEAKKHRKLKRGYEGEVLFDSYVEEIKQDYILIRNMWLSCNGKVFEIDHALLIENAIYLYEVKNFIGEYYYSDDKLYLFSGREIDDPLTQLKRTESLLNQLFHQLGYQVPTQAAVVFVNPECTIFKAPRNKLLLPTQLNRYFRTLPQNRPIDPKFHHLSNKLNSLRLEKSPYEKLPEFHYEDLQKGIPCLKCNGFYKRAEGKMCICQNCGEKELAQSAILRNIEEFMILFPSEKVTSEKIRDWCNIPVPLRRISYTLLKYLEKKGTNTGSYYVKKQLD
ncbi:Nuclease-related domain-containing protein [Gracilibacillus ureilyticus]|uniref:Nuclease-related domain-containing protein n=1 Tax=Gracilibacillus ureilyticus TaxID=531814 RepID=A0A1H9REB3_9BACI|nr:Nuclease-related domain-containing protein [Gracilibacillus ureilyticus]